MPIIIVFSKRTTDVGMDTMIFSDQMGAERPHAFFDIVFVRKKHSLLDGRYHGRLVSYI